MARAIDWAINRKINNGGEKLVVNVGANSNNYQVKDLAYKVAEILPSVNVSINQNAQPDKRSYKVDFSLIINSKNHVDFMHKKLYLF